MPTTVTFKPAVSGDDGMWLGTALFYNNAAQLGIGKASNYYNAFIRFPNITIPKAIGLTVTSAKLTLNAHASNAETVCNLKLFGVAADNPAAPGDWAACDGLSLTTAFTLWNNVAAWTADSNYDSVDITSVVQEWLSRAGRVYGNAFIAVIKNNSSDTSAMRWFHSIVAGAAFAAILTITYTIVQVIPTPHWSDVPSGLKTYTGWTALETECESESIIHDMHTALAAMPGPTPQPTVYATQYPPAFNSTYIKATSEADPTSYAAHLAFDPSKALTGTAAGRSWLGAAATNQRLHVDLGSAIKIERILYHNYHHWGAYVTRGANNFIIQGSNDPAAFADLDYSHDTGWTDITVDDTTFDIHVALDVVDAKYSNMTNTVAYRYYAFKFADDHGDGGDLGVRRIELQTKT